MAGPLIDRLGPGMLLVWDRGFFVFPLAERVILSGAHLLARVPSSALLSPTRRLSDGSYLSELRPTRGHPGPGLVVRVLEYTHDDPTRPGCGQRNRLLTDLLGPDELPAAEAPVVYHQRWEQELAFDELKTHLSGRDVPIRSKTPAGGGARGVRTGAGLLPDSARDPRCGGDRVGGPRSGVVHGYFAGTLVPPTGRAGGSAGRLVS